MSDQKVLSLCASCKYAEWEKTANGRRHPGGSGRCVFQFPDSPLPKWFRVHRYGRNAGTLTRLSEAIQQQWGIRYINWVDRHRLEPEPCATYEAKLPAMSYTPLDRAKAEGHDPQQKEP